jgi:hypothetical protein
MRGAVLHPALVHPHSLHQVCLPCPGLTSCCLRLGYLFATVQRGQQARQETTQKVLIAYLISLGYATEKWLRRTLRRRVALYVARGGPCADACRMPRLVLTICAVLPARALTKPRLKGAGVTSSLRCFTQFGSTWRRPRHMPRPCSLNAEQLCSVSTCDSIGAGVGSGPPCPLQAGQGTRMVAFMQSWHSTVHHHLAF